MTEETKITIYGPMSKLTGPFPLKEVRKATSYPVEGAQFAPTYKKGLWDGRKHMFKPTSGVFPSGLVEEVKQVLNDCAVPFVVEDKREWPKPLNGNFTVPGATMEGRYSFQREVVQKAVDARNGIIHVGTGGGKGSLSTFILHYYGRKSLFIVTTKELMYQAQSRMKSILGLTNKEIGIIGDGIWEPGSFITIGIINTLEKRLDEDRCQELLQSIEVLMVDEAHHAGSETFYDVITSCPALYRFGLSGTPMDRTDGGSMRLLASIGPVIVHVPNKVLREYGTIARADIIFTKVTNPVLPKKLAYADAYKQGIVDNTYLTDLVVEWTKIFHDQGLITLILTEHIAQGKAIDQALWNTKGSFIPHTYIHGKESTEVRLNAIKDLAEKRLPVLIVSPLADEGVDIPAIDAIILAGSKKSRIKTMQRLGRGLRGDKLIAIEFANFTNDYLLAHSLERYEDYKKEECFPLHNSNPDAELVKKLWNK